MQALQAAAANGPHGARTDRMKLSNIALAVKRTAKLRSGLPTAKTHRLLAATCRKDPRSPVSQNIVRVESRTWAQDMLHVRRMTPYPS